MTRVFVILEEFEKAWKRLNLDDSALAELERILVSNPCSGDMIQGTHGARKLRFAMNDSGKSGGARIIYVDFLMTEKIYLITAYGKNEKSNLSKEERNEIKKRIKDIETGEINERRKLYECV